MGRKEMEACCERVKKTRGDRKVPEVELFNRRVENGVSDKAAPVLGQGDLHVVTTEFVKIIKRQLTV